MPPGVPRPASALLRQPVREFVHMITELPSITNSWCFDNVSEMIHLDQCPGRSLHSSFGPPRDGNRCANGCRNYRSESERFIGEDIMTVQFRWPLGMPLVDSLGSGIWEVRSKLPTRIARVLFFVHDEELILLHGFIKKTQKNSTRRQSFGSETKECVHQKQRRPGINIAAAAFGNSSKQTVLWRKSKPPR